MWPRCGPRGVPWSLRRSPQRCRPGCVPPGGCENPMALDGLAGHAGWSFQPTMELWWKVEKNNRIASTNHPQPKCSLTFNIIQPILMINILVIHVPPGFSISWFLKPPFLASKWFPIARSLIAWLGSVGASGALQVAVPRGSRVRASCHACHGRGTKTGLSLTW